MAADAYDSILGLILQGTGNNNNNWGTVFNNSFAAIAARAIAGVNTITATSGTVDLSTTVPPAGPRLDLDHIQLLNGALTADLTVKVPSVSKTWWFQNNTSGGYNVFVQVPGGASPNGLVQIPQGRGIMVMGDGQGNLTRHDKDQIGTSVHHFGTAAPAGTLICNGASLLRAEFPDLYNAIGTTWGSVDSLHFTLPLLTDTNRYLRAGGGSGPGVGTYQSNQIGSHAHTGSVSVSGSTDNQGSHTHSATSTDSGHTHGTNAQVMQSNAYTVDQQTFLAWFNPATASIYTGYANISTTIAAAGLHAHNVSASGSFTTNAAGGSETRPESAAVLICIRY